MMDGGWAPSGSNEMEPEPRRMNASGATLTRPVDRTGRDGVLCDDVENQRGAHRGGPGAAGAFCACLVWPFRLSSVLPRRSGGSPEAPGGQPNLRLQIPIVPRKSGQFRSGRWMQAAHVRTSLLISQNGPVQSLLGKTRRGFFGPGGLPPRNKKGRSNPYRRHEIRLSSLPAIPRSRRFFCRCLR